jgi:hypothetical protein
MKRFFVLEPLAPRLYWLCLPFTQPKVLNGADPHDSKIAPTTGTGLTPDSLTDKLVRSTATGGNRGGRPTHPGLPYFAQRLHFPAVQPGSV